MLFYVGASEYQLTAAHETMMLDPEHNAYTEVLMLLGEAAIDIDWQQFRERLPEAERGPLDVSSLQDIMYDILHWVRRAQFAGHFPLAKHELFRMFNADRTPEFREVCDLTLPEAPPNVFSLTPNGPEHLHRRVRAVAATRSEYDQLLIHGQLDR